MKYMKLTKKMLKSGVKVKVFTKKSLPACMECLPPKPLEGHKMLYGVMVHSRIDCPKDEIYLINTDLFSDAGGGKKSQETGKSD